MYTLVFETRLSSEFPLGIKREITYREMTALSESFK